MDLQSLEKRFRELGARDPAGWARSQIEEGIPQLARFTFLKEAWTYVVAPADTGWLSSQSSEGDRTAREGAAALERVLAAGAAAEDLSAVVRLMQRRLLVDICRVLDEAGPRAHGSDIAWQLFQVEGDEDLTPIPALHESVLETEPDVNSPPTEAS